jgi:signal transduction histidine kinase
LATVHPTTLVMNVAAPHATDIAGRTALSALRSAGAVGCALVLVTIATVLGATAATDDGAIAALLRGTMVAAPLAAGLYARRIPSFERFSSLLLVVGGVSFVTTLAETSDAALYSVGRAAGWTLELLLVTLVLAFPDGPLRGRPDRALIAAMAAVVAVFYLPTLVLTKDFQIPSPYTSCTADCPHNVFFPFGTDHAAIGRDFLGAGALLVFTIMLLVLVRLRGRIAHASAIQRKALVPVLVLGAAREALVGGLIVARQIDATASFVPTGATLIAWATPAIAIAFLVGLVRMRLAAERSLRTLAAAVRGMPDLRALQRAVAAAFDDPTLTLTVTAADAPACWLDVYGEPAPAPEAAGGRCLALVRDGHGVVGGALQADGALSERPELLEAAAGLVAIALTNGRLEAEAELAAVEVRESRARIAASADEERRRIERDLHDGAQQRLVALRIELSLVEDMLQDDPAGAVARIRELEASAEEALEELRALAHGVRPPLLADRGLAEALRSAIARSGLPATLAEQSIRRYPPEIESAVYFCVLEALQNAAKHARGASRVRVRLDGDTHGELWFDVRDDGAGAEDAALEGGVGITNMHDRLAAVDGHLRVNSRCGIGTCVFGRVPATAVGAPQRVQRAG